VTGGIAPSRSGSGGTGSIGGGKAGTAAIDAGEPAADAGAAAAGAFGASVVKTGWNVFSVSVSTNVVRSPGAGRVSGADSAGRSPSTGGGLPATVAIRYFVVSSSRLAGRTAPAATVAANTSIRSTSLVRGRF